MPIFVTPSIESIEYVSNTSSELKFKVKGTDLNKSYVSYLRIIEDGEPVPETFGLQATHPYLVNMNGIYNMDGFYNRFEEDWLIEVDEVIPGKEQILTIKLSEFAKRNNNIDSFNPGDYILQLLYFTITNDGKDSEIITDEIDIEEYNFTTATKSSSSKKYKANHNGTAEKISGSGKKGSKRTITPIEGKKVASVKVTDKNGNEIEVIKNEDGTYSFIQPASNVNVEVTYKNREIKLTIGSNVASVDDEKTNLDVCPVIRNDRTMLPIRFIAENLGAKVEWNELEPNMVYITRGDIKIEIKIGSEIMKVNGKEYILDQVAFAENDRTYLPVRAISEALNAKVLWDELKPNDVTIIEQ